MMSMEQLKFDLHASTDVENERKSVLGSWNFTFGM